MRCCSGVGLWFFQGVRAHGNASSSSGREQVNRLQGPLIRNISNRTYICIYIIYIHMYIYILYLHSGKIGYGRARSVDSYAGGYKLQT